MGNTSSIPEAHVRMYKNLLSIKAIGTRIQMIQTILSSPEHQESARAIGIYGNLLHYIQVIQAGGAPPLLPGERVSSDRKTLSIRNEDSIQRHASEKGNERAMNYFSACLRILELEEEVALTEEALKAAYKKAVIRAHPDKGVRRRNLRR